MKPDIEIYRTQNGAVLVEKSYDPDVPDERISFCFDNHYESPSLPGLVDMLYAVLELFHSGTKRSKQRVQIKLVHGSDYECPGCEICKED